MASDVMYDLRFESVQISPNFHCAVMAQWTFGESVDKKIPGSIPGRATFQFSSGGSSHVITI